MEDKSEALRRASAYAATRAKVTESFEPFPSVADTPTDTRSENPYVYLENLVAVQGFEPRTQRI
jgi:hypothetical protein